MIRQPARDRKEDGELCHVIDHDTIGEYYKSCCIQGVPVV